MATKHHNSFALFAEEEDEDHCCGGHGAPSSSSSSSSTVSVTRQKMDLDYIQEQIIRRRFWPYPSEEQENDSSALPCHCGPLWMRDEGDFWECEHGKWLWVDSWDSVPPLPENHTLDECRGGSCQGHGLFTRDILQLHLATYAGIMWGDIVLMEEEERLAAENPRQRAARLAAEAKKEAERAASIAAFEVQKAKELVALRAAPPNRRYDRRTGKPMPCKFFMYQGVLGKEHPAERDPKTGTMWDSGCAFHKKGKCEFFHPDEPEWQVIIGKVASVPSSSSSSSRPATPEPEWRSVGSNGRPPLHSRPSSGGSSGRSSPFSGGGNSSRSSGSGKGRW
jgi:hypothetical protein